MVFNPDDRNPSDSELLSAIQKGSIEAGEKLCLRHDLELLAVIVSFLNRKGCHSPRDHAEGVKTRAWINIIRHLKKLDDVTKFNAWRDEIARNEAREHLKTCITKQNTAMELKDDSLLPEAQISNYYNSRDAAIDADKILTLADSISPTFALIFRLYNLEGLEFEEIANRLGENKAKLRTVYYRGFKRLIAKVRSRGG
jgi:RNA polymerase sigma factor (sigma-70 family)